MNRRLSNTLRTLASVAFLALPSLCLASPYGAGNYNSGTYNNATIAIGPINLPVTGPALLTYAGIALISVSAGIFVWLRQRRAAAAAAAAAKRA